MVICSSDFNNKPNVNCDEEISHPICTVSSENVEQSDLGTCANIPQEHSNTQSINHMNNSIDETQNKNLDGTNTSNNRELDKTLSLSEESGTENTDMTWGDHLSNANKKGTVKKQEDNKLNINRSFSQKLFTGSKFSKRNPRKSLSFTHRKSESNLKDQKCFSQPETSKLQGFSKTMSGLCAADSSRTGLSASDLSRVGLSAGDLSEAGLSTDDLSATTIYAADFSEKIKNNLPQTSLSQPSDFYPSHTSLLNADSMQNLLELSHEVDNLENSIPFSSSLLKSKIKYGLSQPNVQTVNVVQSVLENKCKALRTVDTGWLQRVADLTGTALENEVLEMNSKPDINVAVKSNNGFPVFSKEQFTIGEEQYHSKERYLSQPQFKSQQNSSLLIANEDDYDSDDIIDESDIDEPSDQTLHGTKKSSIESFTFSKPVMTSTFCLDKKADSTLDLHDRNILSYNKSNLPNNSILYDSSKNKLSGIEENRLDFSNIFKNDARNNSDLSATKKSFINDGSENDTNADNSKAKTRKRAVNNRKTGNSSKTSVLKTKSALETGNGSITGTTTKTGSKSKTTKKRSNQIETNSFSTRKSTRQRKTLQEIQYEADSEPEDPFKENDSESDPEFNLLDQSKKPKSKLSVIWSGKANDSEILENEALLHESDDDVQAPITKKRKTRLPKTKKENLEENGRRRTIRGKQTKSETNISDKTEDDNAYELEFSVRPRIRTVPRINNIKEVVIKKKREIKNSAQKQIGNKNTNVGSQDLKSKLNSLGEEAASSNSIAGIKDKRQIALEKLEKKIATGGLNENFVQVNLKKKVFARGKKTMTFSKYKKQMWKNKKKALCGPDMDMGGKRFIIFPF